MKERPILMTPANAAATRKGLKTNTRRPLAQQPDNSSWPTVDYYARDWNHVFKGYNNDSDVSIDYAGKCPYGQPGDRLYIREEFYAYGIWVKTGTTKMGNPQHKFVDHGRYDAVKRPGHEYWRYSDNAPEDIKKNYSDGLGWYKRPAMFMPKIAARTKVQMVRVWIEKLNDISEVDAIAEGIEPILMPEQFAPFEGFTSAIPNYKALWQSIYGLDSWDKNPFVWCVEYKLVAEYQFVKYDLDLTTPFDPNLIDDLKVLCPLYNRWEECEHWGWEDEPTHYDFGRLTGLLHFSIYKDRIEFISGPGISVASPIDDLSKVFFDDYTLTSDEYIWRPSYNPQMIIANDLKTMGDFIQAIENFMQKVSIELKQLREDYLKAYNLNLQNNASSTL